MSGGVDRGPARKRVSWSSVMTAARAARPMSNLCAVVIWSSPPKSAVIWLMMFCARR